MFGCNGLQLYFPYRLLPSWWWVVGGRWWENIAHTPTAYHLPPTTSCGFCHLLGRGLRRMTLECPGRRKFAELVSYHVLGYVHGDELPPVVDRYCVPDEVGQDRRAAGPRPQHFLFVLLVHRGHLLNQVVVGERSFFERSAHCFPIFASGS